MPAHVIIAGKWDKIDVPSGAHTLDIDVTSHAQGSVFHSLSPFLCGPCELYGTHRATNVENGWQFSKLYAEHADSRGAVPTAAYWNWAKRGWADRRARRYPMGKGAVPLCSWWEGQALSYVEARKTIYVPLYATAVVQTTGWESLVRAYETYDILILRDFDGYNHENFGMSLSGVLESKTRRMGHAFVLKMLLTADAALRLCEWR